MGHTRTQQTLTENTKHQKYNINSLFVLEASPYQVNQIKLNRLNCKRDILYLVTQCTRIYHNSSLIYVYIYTYAYINTDILPSLVFGFVTFCGVKLNAHTLTNTRISINFICD